MQLARGLDRVNGLFYGQLSIHNILKEGVGKGRAGRVKGKFWWDSISLLYLVKDCLAIICLIQAKRFYHPSVTLALLDFNASLSSHWWDWGIFFMVRPKRFFHIEWSPDLLQVQKDGGKPFYFGALVRDVERSNYSEKFSGLCKRSIGPI